GRRDLTRVPTALINDPPREELALLRDNTAETVDVLVVHFVDLLAAEVAVALADRPSGGGATLPALLSLVSSLRHQNGMSSSPPEAKSALLTAGAPLGTNWGCSPS